MTVESIAISQRQAPFVPVLSGSFRSSRKAFILDVVCYKEPLHPGISIYRSGIFIDLDWPGHAH